MKKIKSALISVYYKDNLENIIQLLMKHGVTMYSTGGTQQFIEQLGGKVERVEDLTSYPSIFGGRVKTLHPKVFGGILHRRDNTTDKQEAYNYQIPEIDLVIVDLYPFEATVASGASHEDTIEKIDIGGISLIRAAAKNYNDVIIVSSKDDYGMLEEMLRTQDGGTTLEQRRLFAAKAFNTSSHYDTAIFNYFNREAGINVFKQSIQNGEQLRYGENPHQKATYYGNLDDVFEKHNGKELSYNNLVDVAASVELIKEFTEPTVAIIKHTNACGIATAATITQAYLNALSCDPVSAFGGIIAMNRPVDKTCADELNKLFFEVVIAPAYDVEALTILKEKKNRIILQTKNIQFAAKQYKSLLNGVLEQDKDLKTETAADFKTVTSKAPTADEVEAMLFAIKVVKHTKSNTIVLAKKNQLLASGLGQTSRVDALKQAIVKAKAFGFDLNGAVMSSDAFFPFPDCVEIANAEGIKAVSQPGGSIKDQDSIDFCNKNGVAMVFTGTRHFLH